MKKSHKVQQFSSKVKAKRVEPNHHCKMQNHLGTYMRAQICLSVHICVQNGSEKCELNRFYETRQFDGQDNIGKDMATFVT